MTAPGQGRTAPLLVPCLARWLLRIFFREVEVVGRERVPPGGPLVLVANHINALVDPALLLGFLPVRPRLLAKSTLWAHPVVRPFLGLAAAIPVYRRQDPGIDPAKNVETFAACHEVLRAGGAIAIFPEGRSHNEPALVPLRTGVSRIVLEAEAKYGRLGVRIVPVGLTFDDKGRFRSRVLVHVGEPLDPTPEVDRFGDDPEAAVRTLTDRVRSALAAVTLNFPSWEEARLIERAAEIFEQPAPEMPAESSLSDRFALRQTFIDGYARLRQHCPAEVAEVAAAVSNYDRRLRLLGLSDLQVAAAYPRGPVVRFVVRTLWLLLVGLPLALVGSLIHGVPYRVVDWTARRWGKRPDNLATYKVFASVVVYPLTWLLVILAGGWLGGWPAGLAAAGVGPVSALFALRFHERRDHFGHHVRAFFLLRSRRRTIATLRRERAEVLRAVRALAEVYQRQSAPPREA